MKKKIAFILYTEALEFDDRIRKEAISLLKSGNVEIKIFTILANNRAEEGVTSYGVPFKSFKLKTRSFFRSASFLALKTFEFYLKVRPFVKDYDILWPHNVESFLFPLFIRKKKIVWDLHEIPARFEKNSLTKKLFRFLEEKCNSFIHANQYRIDYLLEKGLITKPQKHFVLRNFPDNAFEKSEVTDPDWKKFDSWLGGSEYVYLQGLKQTMRYPEQVIESIMQTENIKAAVIGGFEERALNSLISKYGDALYDKIYFRGKINQLSTPNYIRRAKFSIIVYQTDYDANHLYCEANRLYQTIIFDKPVIVGCNPPMADLVNQYGFGVSMKNDGRNIDEIINAISLLINDIDKYKKNIANNKHEILWEKQEYVLENVVKSLIE